MPTQRNNEFEGAPYDYSGPAWSGESGLVKWMRENPDEVRELDRALANQLGDDMRTTWEYLHQHPTPWRCARHLATPSGRDGVTPAGHPGSPHQVIEDADGNQVLTITDCEHDAAQALVTFINAAAHAYIR